MNAVCTSKVIGYRLAMHTMLATALIGCSLSEYSRSPGIKANPFVSATYNHFEGGVLFKDVAVGVDVLWQASFRNGHTYKENVGFFVPEGLVIAPNKENKFDEGKLTAFPLQIINGSLFIRVGDRPFQVLAIIHTHPDAS